MVLQSNKQKWSYFALSWLLSLGLGLILLGPLVWLSTPAAQAAASPPYRPYNEQLHNSPVLSSETIISLDSSVLVTRTSQGFPALIFNNVNNRFMAVWSDRRNEGTSTSVDLWENTDIYGQVIQGVGSLSGTNKSVAIVNYIDESEPTIAYNPARNEFLVTWRWFNNTYYLGNRVIKAVRVGPDGSTLGTAQDLSDSATTIIQQDKHQPVVANGVACGEYLAVWTVDKSSTQNIAENYDIYARRVLSNTGVATGTEIAVTTAISSQHFPAVAHNPAAHEYLVVWQSFQNGHFDIYGQRLNCSGVLQGSPMAIATAAGVQVHPAVAYNSSRNEYLVLWEDYRNGQADIYAQRIQADGSLLGSNFVIVNVANSQTYPQIAYDSQTTLNDADRYVVVWEDMRSGQNSDIYGQWLSGDGSLIGTGNFGITQADGDQHNPVIAYNSTNDTFAVAWADGRIPDDADIYSRILFFTGPALTIEKTGPEFVSAGARFTYTLTIRNNGSQAVNNLVVSDTLPAEANYVTGGTLAGNVVSWAIDSLSANGGTTQTAFVVTATTSLTNSSYGVTASGGYSATGTVPVFTRVEIPVDGLLAVNDSPTVLSGTTRLTATVTAGSNVNYAWGFGDGTSGVGPTVAHVYPAVGVYTAVVTVSNSVSLITKTTRVTVTDRAIAGLLAVNDSPTLLGDTTRLTATVTAGSNVSYAWGFGDGTSGVGLTMTHVYPAVGVYTAVVTASNGVSLVTGTTRVTVTDRAITGLLAVNDSPMLLGDTTRLTATVTAGSNVNYAWDFGDGSSGTGPTMTHVYPAVGVYTAVVTASNSVSLLTETTRVTVTDRAITGLLAVNDSPTVLSGTTRLTATVTAGSNVNYAWGFGDGSSGTGPTVTHIYPAVGVYTAVVTASNSVSLLTDTTWVTVTDRAITGLLVVNDSPTVLSDTTRLTATVTAGSNVNYVWDFGDSSSETCSGVTIKWLKEQYGEKTDFWNGVLEAGSVITYTYPTIGVYTAVVTAYNSVNWISATSQIIIINDDFDNDSTDVYLPVIIK